MLYPISSAKVEKIVNRFVVGDGSTVRSGDFVAIKPLHVLTHDNTSAVISKFLSIGKNVRT